jgi:hypothetical protein
MLTNISTFLVLESVWRCDSSVVWMVLGPRLGFAFFMVGGDHGVRGGVPMTYSQLLASTVGYCFTEEFFWLLLLPSLSVSAVESVTSKYNVYLILANEGQISLFSIRNKESKPASFLNSGNLLLCVVLFLCEVCCLSLGKGSHEFWHPCLRTKVTISFSFAFLEREESYDWGS